jgi:hypothetical protein
MFLISYILLRFNDYHFFIFSEPAPKKSKDVSDSEDEFDRQDAERLQDLDERDAFAGRLKNKDKEKMRQIMSKSEKKVRGNCF